MHAELQIGSSQENRPSSHAQAGGRSRGRWLVLIALAAIWIPVVQLLSPQWSIYEQYAYGWAVPFLCLFLAWQRWRVHSISPSVDLALRLDRGEGKGEVSNFISALGSPSFLTRRSLLLLLFLACLALLPLRILQEANPLWRLASYGLALDAIAVTLLLLFFLSRSAFRHFAFPVCFFLVAIPWPTPVETFVIQNLTRFNTMVVTEIVNAFGIATAIHGNVIEVSTGMLGMEEACSGIRSLQAVLMITLFFGELHRLSIARRMTLVMLGAVTALLLNIVRTTILVVLAARDGIASSNRWHDLTGTVVLLGCFIGVWMIGRALRPAGAPAQSGRRFSVALPAGFLSPWVPCAVIVFSLISVIATELWFRIHERQQAGDDICTLSLPRERTGYREIALSDEVRKKLQFDAADSAAWRNPDGTLWQLFHFRWNPAVRLKDRVRIQLAKSHRPEICLPASGWQLKQESAPTLVEIGGIPLDFRTYDFSAEGHSLFVFFCVREDATPAGNRANMRETHIARWRAAWEGNRGLGQRVIEIAISGARDLTDAQASLRRYLPPILQIQSSHL